MATKSDQTALHSSIALLQERFKRLQKMKEMRQERELLRLLSETHERRSPSSSYSSSPAMHYQPSASSLYSNSEVVFHQKPSSQLDLSLWPDSQMKHANFAGLEATAQDTKSWLYGTSLGNSSSIMNKFDDYSSDVDTSLHL